jgi:hypothetical protein
LYICAALVGAWSCADPGEPLNEALPITHDQASLHSAENARSLIQSLSESISFLDDSAVLTAMAWSPLDVELSLEESGDRLGDWLTSRILNQANVESVGDGMVMYRLNPDVVCVDEIDGRAVVDIQSDCSRLLSTVAVRLEVSWEIAGRPDIRVLIGETLENPLTFHVHPGSLSARLDLGSAWRSAQAIADALGNDRLPTIVRRLEGVVEMQIAEGSPNHFTASLSILEPVVVALSEDEGELTILLPAASNAFWMDLDGTVGTALAGIEIGVIDIVLPMAALGDNGSLDFTRVGLHLAGLSGSVLFDSAGDLLQFAGLGLGDETTRVTVDGQTVLSIDLNANLGRRFDLWVDSYRDGTGVTVEPTFDLRVHMSLAELVAGGLEVPAWAVEEILSIVVDGARGPALWFENGSDLVEVVVGRIMLISDMRRLLLVAIEGQCIHTSDDALALDADEHPLANLVAETCR